MIHSDETFLAAIEADFENDLPRLAYADWLDAQGRGDQAQFIRLQCHEAGLPWDDPQRRPLRKRQEELLAAGQPRWLGPVADLNGQLEIIWQRGLPDSAVWYSKQMLGDDLQRLAAVRSLRTLVLRGSRLTGDKLALLAPLHRLRKLMIIGARVADDGLVQLQLFRHLDLLTLEKTRVRGPGLAALAALPDLRELTVVFSGEVDDAALSSLAGLRQLHRLTLGGPIRDATLEHLAQLPDLRELRLAGNPRVTHAGLRRLHREVPFLIIR